MQLAENKATAYKIAIMGGAPSSRDLEPDDGFEIWAHGNQLVWRDGKRIDKIFEIHDDISEQDEGYPQYLVDQNIHLVVGAKFPLKAKHVEVFPFAEANAIMGEKLTSTPAYMMAYALIHGATDIAIHGVDMSVDDLEYFYQRPAMYAWIAYAKAKGVNVIIPENSSLFVDRYIEGKDSGGKPDLGIEPFTQAQFNAMADLHHERATALEAEVRKLQNGIIAHNAARSAYQQMAKIGRAVEDGQTIKSLVEQSRVI